MVRKIPPGKCAFDHNRSLPDSETAGRVMAAIGRRVTRLSDTELELHESKVQANMAKKLREAGIFIRG
jgi:hypothetical protein